MASDLNPLHFVEAHMKAQRSPKTKGDALVGQNVRVLVLEEECTIAPGMTR